MKIIESNMLDRYENVEYLYVFHDLVSHNVGTDLHYAVSKTYYFASGEKFYKQHEMLQDGLDAKDFKDESACLNHVAKLNKEQLSSVEKKKTELKSIQKSATASSTIKDLIAFHDEVIGLLLEWFNKNGIQIVQKKISSGRPKGSKNKLTIKKYNWIRDKYYFLKKKKKAHTIDEHARIIRSQLLKEKPDFWDKHIYTLVTIIDIIKKQKWGD